jgi:predicted Zn finger-like uncharacterized protein
MKISCQNCSSKYTVSDEKVQGKTVKLKCKKCGATILVNSSGATTVASGGAVADHPSSPAEAPSTDGTSYLVNVAEGDQRTMTIPDLVGAYQSQVITADTYVWADGMTDWQPLGQVESIVAALSAGAQVAAPAPMAAAPMAAAPMAAAPMAAASSAEAAASAASLAASARPAARREPAKRADVFGNEKNDDIATSAPLFSASAKAAASNAAAAAKSGAPREENSVLFSLSALTAKPAAAAPAPAPSRKDSREDSGLIDLKALAASAAPSPAAAAASASIMGHDDAGLFPLGVPAANQPAAPPVAANVTIPPPASKAPMFIGVGALVAALAIVGVFFAMRGGDEKPVADTTQPTVTAPAAQPTPSETVAAAPTTTATAEPTATATAVAAKGKAGTGKAGTGKAGTAPTSGGGSSGGTAPAATTAKPVKSKCNCAPTDLMCNMACSAK